MDRIKNLPLPPEEQIERDADGLLYINICSVLDLIYPSGREGGGYWFENADYLADDYEAQNVKVIAYMNAHDLHYYGRCKEDFFTREAGEEARKAGKKGVVLDNLS